MDKINLTIDKQGSIVFYETIEGKTISLNYITLYYNIYNITDSVEFISTSGSTIDIEPGNYSIEDLIDITNGGIDHDENTLKVKVNGRLSTEFEKLFENEFPYLTPLNLYLYADCINSSKNLLNGKRSELLSIIPIGKAKVGEIFSYKPISNIRSINTNRFNNINFKLCDKDGNKYKGKFIAEFTITE